MSSRALRRLREEKEAALAAAEEDDEEESSDDDDEDGGGGAGGGFMMMLEEESSSDESSSSSESEGEGEEDDDDDEKEKGPPPAVVQSTKPPKNNKKGGKKQQQQPEEEEEEEDLDAILSDMNINNNDNDNDPSSSSKSNNRSTTLRSLLLSKNLGFDIQDLDLDYALRSLVGGAAAAAAGGGGGGGDALGDEFAAAAAQAQQQQRQRGRPGQNQRGRRTLAKRYLFGKPKIEWGKPPSFVGGGLGSRELTPDVLEEERHSWSVPWPYNILSGGGDEEDGDNGENGDEEEEKTRDGKNTAMSAGGGENGEVEGKGENNSSGEQQRQQRQGEGGIPMIPSSNQRWFTLQMSDTYQEHNYIYQEMLSSSSNGGASRQQGGGGGGLHDPNSLAMFVSDHPYFAETLLQLAMVLYYINDRARGSDLLRRTMFLYESALPSNVILPPQQQQSNNNNNVHGGSEILIDIDRAPNSGLFAALFRIMQTSGMSGCYDNALATGRFLLSLDPLRDPMGVLPILDYYALLGSRRRRRGGYDKKEEEDVDAGAAFVVELVESKLVRLHYRDPLTDRHHWCQLEDMPNWAFSYALALHRLSLQVVVVDNDDDVDDESHDDHNYAERAEDALVHALTQFPMVLPRLLAMNKINTRDRSFRMDWPTILSHFTADEEDTTTSRASTVQDRVTRASGEHLVRIFVQRCHKLLKEEDVVQWLYRCAEKAVEEHKEKYGEEGETTKEGNEIPPPAADDDGQQASKPSESEAEVTSAAATIASSTPLPPMISTFSPALARYAQCDPSEYEDSFRTFPLEAIALDPNIVAPAMALGPNGARRRFVRQAHRRQQQHAGGGNVGGGVGMEGQDPLDVVQQLLGMGRGDVEVLDPDSPLLQLYLQSLLPWAQVEGVRPPPR